MRYARKEIDTVLGGMDLNETWICEVSGVPMPRDLSNEITCTCICGSDDINLFLREEKMSFLVVVVALHFSSN